jgi:oxalate decarboxylase
LDAARISGSKLSSAGRRDARQQRRRAKPGWQFFISGKARMTVFATGGRARTMDFDTGDVGYAQKTLPHYVENTGNPDLRSLEMSKSSYYQDLALSEWLSHTPPELVAAHLNLDKATLDALPRGQPVILPE